MSQAYAVEIVLLRALAPSEVEVVQARTPGRYAFSSDRKHAIEVRVADTASEALGQAWADAAVGGLPEIDVIWSVHADQDGRVQMRLELDADVDGRLRDRAERLGVSKDALVEEALRAALERESRERHAAACGEVGQLLQRFSLEELVTALAAATVSAR